MEDDVGFKAINPANGDEISLHPYIKDDDLKSAIETSFTAFQFQKAVSYKERAEKLRTLGDLMEKDLEMYARLITSQMGKPVKQAIAEVKKCVQHCRWYADNADRLMTPKVVETEAQKSYVALEPIGPIYQIVPFNFPFWLTFKPAVAIILLGNTILHRNAKTTPDCGLAIEKLFRDAGFTNGEFINVFTQHEQTEYLIAHKKVRGVTFTGSTGAGAKVAQQAGLQIKKCVMELGGSDPVVILEDADPDTAAEVSLQSRCRNAGQVCIAGKRFIVHDKIYEQFMNHLVDKVRNYKIGDPMLETTDMGPLARADLISSLERQIKKSIAEGGNIALGGGRPLNDELGKGNYFTPTIIECKEGNIILKEETFGPLFAVIKASDEDELVRIANDSDFGLGAVVIGKDIDRAEKIARLIESGSVFINRPVDTDRRLPSGGIKASGFGRECGEWGLSEFANVKTVWIHAGDFKA